jgi:hypothetical protein
MGTPKAFGVADEGIERRREGRRRNDDDNDAGSDGGIAGKDHRDVRTAICNGKIVLERVRP